MCKIHQQWCVTRIHPQKWRHTDTIPHTMTADCIVTSEYASGSQVTGLTGYARSGADAVDFFVKVSVSIWNLTATKCWFYCCCLWFRYRRMLTLFVAVSFDIGMSIDDTSSFERLTDSEDTGGETVWQGVRSVHKVCESAVCVQVSVNIFD